MSIYDFSQYYPQSGLLSQPGFSQQQGLLARMDPWTSEYQQAAGTPGLFGHQTPELPTWQQQASFLPDWDKMFPKAEENGNGNGNGNGNRPHAPEGGAGEPDASGSFGGVPWQDSPFAGLIGKLGINPVYAGYDPSQEEIDAAVAAANAAPMGALEREIAGFNAGRPSGGYGGEEPETGASYGGGYHGK